MSELVAEYCVFSCEPTTEAIRGHLGVSFLIIKGPGWVKLL